MGDPGQMCRSGQHRQTMVIDIPTCQKQHRQNEIAGQVDIPTRVKVLVMGDPGHV